MRDIDNGRFSGSTNMVLCTPRFNVEDIFDHGGFPLDGCRI